MKWPIKMANVVVRVSTNFWCYSWTFQQGYSLIILLDYWYPWLFSGRHKPDSLASKSHKHKRGGGFIVHRLPRWPEHVQVMCIRLCTGADLLPGTCTWRPACAGLIGHKKPPLCCLTAYMWLVKHICRSLLHQRSSLASGNPRVRTEFCFSYLNNTPLEQNSDIQHPTLSASAVPGAVPLWLCLCAVTGGD